MSRLDTLTVRQVVNAVNAGARPGVPDLVFKPKFGFSKTAPLPGDLAQQFALVASGALQLDKAPAWITIWRLLGNRKHPMSRPDNPSFAPSGEDLKWLYDLLEPFRHPTPEEAAELAAVQSHAWMNHIRGAEQQVFTFEPFPKGALNDTQHGSESTYTSPNGLVIGRTWADAKPFIIGLPRLEAIFLKFPWDYPAEYWQKAWTTVVGNAKIEELSKLAYSGVSDADLDGAFRTTIANNADAIIAETEHLMQSKAKSDAKRNLLRTIATIGISIMTAGIAGPLVAALGSQAMKIPDQIADAKAAADALKAQDASKAAQERDAAEQQANAFYAQYPGPFEKEGYTADVWKNLSFDEKVAVMKAISTGQKPVPPPGMIVTPLPEIKPPSAPAPAPVVIGPPIPGSSPTPTVPTGYVAVVEGVPVGAFDKVDDAVTKAMTSSSPGDRVEVLFNGQTTGLGIKTDHGIIQVPTSSEAQVRSMSPDQVHSMLASATAQAAATATEPAPSGGFSKWLLAIPALYFAVKS